VKDELDRPGFHWGNDGVTLECRGKKTIVQIGEKQEDGVECGKPKNHGCRRTTANGK